MVAKNGCEILNQHFKKAFEDTLKVKKSSDVISFPRPESSDQMSHDFPNHNNQGLPGVAAEEPQSRVTPTL